MSSPIVANSTLSTQETVHFLFLLLWSIVLLPAGAARDSPRFLLSAACTSSVGLLIWWSSPAPPGTNTTVSQSILDIPAWQSRRVPETLFVGVLITCIAAQMCRPFCPDVQKLCSKKTKWGIIMLAGIVLPLIALDTMSGSCGGKIVTGYKKGYEIFSEMSDDLCSAHFSYLTLSGTAFLTGCSWHYVAETSVFSTHIVRGLENILLCMIGVILLAFRSVTVATFVSSEGTSSSDSFFGNGGQLADGIVWGKISGAAVAWIVVGVLGIFSILIGKCRWLGNACVIISLFSLSVSLLSAGASTENTFFGQIEKHHDPTLGIMQATCLSTSGLLALLVTVLRTIIPCLTQEKTAGILYYLRSVCGIAATSIGGFVLCAQPAMTQMLARDLSINCWGVTVVVLIFSVSLHMLLRVFIAAPSKPPSESEKA